MRGTRLADFHRLAERLGKSCGRRRGICAGALRAARLARTTIDTIAEFLLGCANLSQEPDRIERAIISAHNQTKVGAVFRIRLPLRKS